MNDLSLAWHQARYENKVFWRNPPAAFFTLFFPVMFLVIFNLVFGGSTEKGGFTDSTFYVPALTAFAVISACYTNLAMNVSIARDQGRLKRVRGTPLPTWAYLIGKIANAITISALVVIIVLVIGVSFYGADISGANWGEFAIGLVVGAICFCALGMAIVPFIRNEDAAPAVVNATIFPLLFISDVFIPLPPSTPHWLTFISSLFPVIHFAHALLYSFIDIPNHSFNWWDVAVMAIWAATGSFVAITRFSWQPRR
jgi:ABC-2 type transport system permease protein